jgi:anti-sigma regulatory factor (Ser/Thr protein kinase)
MFGVDLSSIREGLSIDPLLVVRIYCISFLFYTVNKFIDFYYPSSPYITPAVLVNVLRMGLIGPIAIFFLMMGFGVSGYSYGVILMEASASFIVFLFIFLMKKINRYQGKGVLLLPKDEKNEASIDLSIPAKEEEVPKIVEEIQKQAFALSNDEKAAVMLAVACEEIIVNTMEYGYKRHGPSEYIDINITKTEEGILVRIRDDGIAYDPTTYEAEDEEMRYHGIEVVRKVAKDFKYLRLLNTNNTIMEIALSKVGE